jgi:hypothetical protein
MADLKRKGDLVAFIQGPQPGALNRRDVDENVRAAFVRRNETKALLAVEPFYGAGRHGEYQSLEVGQPPAIFIAGDQASMGVRESKSGAG